MTPRGKKLTKLEKSHLASLAKRESRTVETAADIRALNKLVAVGYAKVTDWDEAEGDPDGWSVTAEGEAAYGLGKAV